MDIIEEILDKVKNLPPLSTSAAEIIRMADKDNVNAGAMAAIIEKDPDLAGQLLRVANSAAFHPTNPIGSIQLAVSFLGNRTTMGIIMGFCLSGVYKTPLKGYLAPEGALWRYSLATAIAARFLTKFSKVDISPELAYTAGLLHPIGKSVISEFLSIKDIDLAALHDSDDDFTNLEKNSLGIDHCEVGKAIAEQWNLPTEICQVIGYYNSPQNADDEHKPLAYLVHLASFVAMMGGKGTGLDSLQYNLDEKYDEFINISTAHDLERVVINVQQEFEIMVNVS